MLYDGVEYELRCLSISIPEGYRHMGVMTPTPNEYIIFDLMQFTGLLDKNGKEIYEGDIVNCTVFSHRIVKYNDKQASFKYYAPTLNISSEMLKSDVERHDEVIGNIYENPELMK